MFYLKITSLEWVVRNEEIKQLTIDTEAWQLTILPWHDNMLSVLKPGLVKILPAQTQQDRKFDFLVDREYIVFGVLGGVLKVEWNQLQVLTNMVIIDNQNPVDFLQKSRQSLLERLHEKKGADLDHHILEADLHKVDVELKLAFRKER